MASRLNQVSEGLKNIKIPPKAWCLGSSVYTIKIISSLHLWFKRNSTKQAATLNIPLVNAGSSAERLKDKTKDVMSKAQVASDWQNWCAIATRCQAPANKNDHRGRFQIDCQEPGGIKANWMSWWMDYITRRKTVMKILNWTKKTFTAPSQRMLSSSEGCTLHQEHWPRNDYTKTTVEKLTFLLVYLTCI